MHEKSAIIEIIIQLLSWLVFVICGFIKDFLPNSYFILQIYHAKSFKMRLRVTFSALKSKSQILSHMTHLRNWEKVSVYFSIFLAIRLTKIPFLPNCQVPNGFFWYDCTFQPSNLEKYTLSLSQFLRYVT
jgi:hypothetical protein